MSQSQTSLHSDSLHSDPLIRLEEAFKSADEDNDDLLNKKEFTKFVEMGYGKQCSQGMYESVCEKFKSDPQLGVNWNTAKTIYIQANNNRKSKPETSHSYTNSNSLSISSDTGGNVLSPYNSHRRTSTFPLTELHTSDISSMIVDILDKKIKGLQNKLIKERNKRKKTEEIAQSLLNQNDEYKLQINTLKNKNIEIKNKYNLVNEQNIKLESNINEYKINLKHITSERNQIKKELNEGYEICNTIEKDRKQQSLIKALQAVDNITKISHEQTIETNTISTSEIQTDNNNDSASRNQRRSSYAPKRIYNRSLSDSEIKKEIITYKPNITVKVSLFDINFYFIFFALILLIHLWMNLYLEQCDDECLVQQIISVLMDIVLMITLCKNTGTNYSIECVN